MIRIALTMGDPAGIGPEIAIKALSSSRIPKNTAIAVVGDLKILEQAATTVGSTITLVSIDENFDGYQENCVNVIDMKQILPGEVKPGALSAPCGKASYEYVLKGIQLALDKKVDAIVTNPINKEALKSAGIQYPGHTEILAEETGTIDFTMMFRQENVSVVHVTTHTSLKQAIEQITIKKVLTNIELLHKSVKSMGIANPRIAVGGLNPHAGEAGLFGTEEIDYIIPAIEKARIAGIDATGPYPPDTVFMRAFKGEFDGIVSMLHDHGFVALKSRDFEKGVNITIGLPIIRTSVGHGTAFEIAGTGKASEEGLLSAIDAAIRLIGKKP